MCWEDVKINRNKGGSQITVPVLAASTLVTGTNPRRTGLVILGIDASTTTVSIGRIAVAGQGINLSPTSAPVVLTYDDIGSVIEDAVYAISAAPNNITIVEAELPLERSEAVRE